MDLLTIAMGLVKVAPMIAGWFGGDKAEAAATEVVGIAEKLSGKTGLDAVAAINADPAMALEFQKAVLADKHRLDELYLQDKADARKMYAVHHEQTDRISERIMSWNLWSILALVIVNGLAIYYLKEQAAVLATVSNLLGIVIKSLLDERKEVTGFYFGSSAGSKAKDSTPSR